LILKNNTQDCEEFVIWQTLKFINATENGVMVITTLFLFLDAGAQIWITSLSSTIWTICAYPYNQTITRQCEYPMRIQSCYQIVN